MLRWNLRDYINDIKCLIKFQKRVKNGDITYDFAVQYYSLSYNEVELKFMIKYITIMKEANGYPLGTIQCIIDAMTHVLKTKFKKKLG